MVPALTALGIGFVSLPRASGDGPHGGTSRPITRASPPRERGWSLPDAPEQMPDQRLGDCQHLAGTLAALNEQLAENRGDLPQFWLFECMAEEPQLLRLTSGRFPAAQGLTLHRG